MSSLILLTSCIFLNGTETSLAVQWLRLGAANAGSRGSVSRQGTRILHATQHGQTTTKKNLS